MRKVRALVVGKTGQIAQALAETVRSGARADIACGFFGRPELDLEHTDLIKPFLDAYAPDIILNAAAYTEVDKAETETERADFVNHRGPRALAEWTAAHGIPILHMSTDCVFDGTKDGGYIESDAPKPLSVYGRSKADGEAAVAAANSKHLIVRVGWVHSQFGKSFPRTMLRLAETRDEVTVVDDQFGRPTHALDLAEGLLTMAETCLEQGFSDWGVYHLAGQGETNRARMAEAVFEDSAAIGGPTAKVAYVSTRTFGAAAERPLNARLDSLRAEVVFGLRLPEWRERLTDCVHDILRHSL